MKNFQNFDIILASQSPRRQQLLSDLGVDFRTVTKPGIEETYPDSITGTNIAAYLSELKAAAFRDEIKENSILITADTIVVNNDNVLGKPEDRDNAIAMLQELSGKKHQVATGVTLTSKWKQLSFTATTDVYFKALDLHEIEYYIDTFQPYDKAGAYGIQEWIGYIAVERIEGSYFNVMGLPVQQLYTELIQFVAEN